MKAPERIWLIPIELYGKDIPPCNWPDGRGAEEAIEYMLVPERTPEEADEFCRDQEAG